MPLFGCRDCGDCSLPEIAYVCPESQCAKNQRNGPCGGTREGLCEVYDTECIWSQAYERLKAYGEEESMLDGPVDRQGQRARADERVGEHVPRPRPPRPALSMEPRLSYVIGRLDRVLRRRLAAAVEPTGLTLPAYVALSVLRAQDGLSNAQLARRSLVTPQSMSEALTQLVDLGYVRRRADPDHGRIIRTELTPAGSRALERCDRAVDDVEREMLGDLDADEAESLRDALIRCSRALEHELVERAG